MQRERERTDSKQRQSLPRKTWGTRTNLAQRNDRGHVRELDAVGSDVDQAARGIDRQTSGRQTGGGVGELLDRLAVLDKVQAAPQQHNHHKQAGVHVSQMVATARTSEWKVACAASLKQDWRARRPLRAASAKPAPSCPRRSAAVSSGALAAQREASSSAAACHPCAAS